MADFKLPSDSEGHEHTGKPLSDNMKRTVWLEDGDLSQWDQFVKRHSLGSLFQTSSWKKVIERSFPHIRCRICAIVDAERELEIQAGIPVYTVKSWLLGNRLVSTPFATLCDPLISSTTELDELSLAIRQRQQLTSARFIEIRTHHSSALFHESKMRASLSYLHHFIRLKRTESEIVSSFGRTAVRQMLVKAANKGIETYSAQSLPELTTFHSLLSQTRQRLGLPPIPFRFFQSLWDIYEKTNQLTLLLARQNGRIAGGVMALKWRDTFSLEYAADDGKLRKSGIVQCLYWEAIKCARQEGYSIFSLGRTYRGNVALLRSKSHWGAEMEELKTFFYPETTHKDAEDREASLQYRLIKMMARHLPPPACRLLGDFCYRHMG